MSEPTSGRPNRRGRRVLAWVASVLAALGLLAGGIETIARASVGEQLASRAPEGVRIETTGLVLPGLLTGQVSVRASIDASGLAQLGMDSVTGIDQAIEVTRVRHTPIGAVPIVVRLSPTVTGGHLGLASSPRPWAGSRYPWTESARRARQRWHVSRTASWSRPRG